MNTQTLRFPLTAVAVMLAIIVLAAALLGDVAFVEWPVGLVDRLEHDEIGEIATVIVLVIAAFFVDQAVAARRTQREVNLQTERLRVVHVTMRTVHDIVNNALTQLQLVRFEAEGRVSQEALSLFDEAIHDTAAKLKALGDLNAYAEHQLAVGAGLGAIGTPLPLEGTHAQSLG